MGWIIVGIVVLVIVFFVSIYNRLVSGRNAYKNAFAQIDVQLTRRHDLIPNLVETAKGYIKHERGTLEAVIAARNAASAANTRAAQIPGDAAAMKEPASTENKVAFARQAYNDAVMSYNTTRETFPTNLIAGPFNFGPAELFT